MFMYSCNLLCLCKLAHVMSPAHRDNTDITDRLHNYVTLDICFYVFLLLCSGRDICLPPSIGITMQIGCNIICTAYICTYVLVITKIKVKPEAIYQKCWKLEKYVAEWILVKNVDRGNEKRIQAKLKDLKVSELKHNN